MSNQKYIRPPITEAVIEISFVNPHDKKSFSKAISKFKSSYSGYQELVKYSLKVDISTTNDDAKVTKTPVTTHRFSSEDMTEMLLLNDSSISVAQLAPYSGWDDFIDRFKKNWSDWKRIAGFNEIKRIGVRYINRLDIPAPDKKIKVENYLKLYPEIPEELGVTHMYAVQTMHYLEDIKSHLKINTAQVDSPKPKHIAILIDQDLSREVELPQNDAGLITYLKAVRDKKNNIFEACVTDEARKIFG